MEFNSLTRWKAEGMRFSLFKSNLQAEHNKWWESFTGTPHASTTSKAATSEHLYNGEFGEGILELRVLPDRIDWVYGPKPKLDSPIPNIGVFQEQLVFFIESLTRWISNYSGSYLRLAFASTILNETEDRSSGYRELNSLLPFMPLLNGEFQDFFLQLNKPKVTNTTIIKDVKLNRLINYSVANLQMVNFNTGVLRPVHKHFTRVEFDINTQAESINEFNNTTILELIKTMTDITDAVKSVSEA